MDDTLKILQRTKTICDVACTVCGCVCDDLEIRIEKNRIVEIEGACSLAKPWFAAANEAKVDATSICGIPTSFEEAIRHSTQLLRHSRNPLIFGLSRSSTPGQRAAVLLAERIGANIDTTASVCHGPSIMAIQQTGESTSSLGEVRNRADLVIFWGANPVESHPRHFDRYSVDPVGAFIPRGRLDRTVIVVDRKSTSTSQQADLFLQVHADRDFEAIWTLRQLIRGEEPDQPVDTGLSREALREFAERLMNCQYGVVFFGLGIAQSPLGHLTVEALLRLVAELNQHTRFVARRLRLPGDVSGADSVLCWQTGFPYGVNMGRGFPRYNPGEFTAEDLLVRDEVDCCVVVGSESTQMLSADAQSCLQSIPTIVLDYPHVALPWQPDVNFTTAVYGLHAPGTIYRMDEIPIGLRKIIDSPFKTDADVLTALVQGIA